MTEDPRPDEYAAQPGDNPTASQPESRRLSVNYRTTQEILAWAVPLLGSASSGQAGATDRAQQDNAIASASLAQPDGNAAAAAAIVLSGGEDLAAAHASVR